jgi:hypothetical protein
MIAFRNFANAPEKGNDLIFFPKIITFCHIQIFMENLLKARLAMYMLPAKQRFVASGDTSNKETSLNPFPCKADINTEAILKTYEVFTCGILIHFVQMCWNRETVAYVVNRTFNKFLLLSAVRSLPHNRQKNKPIRLHM